MRCEQARAAVSAAADGALAAPERQPLAAHLERCPHCRRFADDVSALRRRLRFEAVDEVPDVAPTVVAALRGRRSVRRLPRRQLLQAAAVFAAGILAGGAFVGLDPRQPPQVAAAALPERVVDTQQEVDTYQATVEVVELGWHPQVDQRRFRGTVTYAAPESFALRLEDLTEYPSAAWPDNDVDLVVRDDYQWQRATPGCPTPALPGCLPDQPRVRAVTRRPPFDEASPAPLDLIVPVDGFALAAAPAALARAELDGRAAVGVDVTVAQARALLDGLLGAGNWRALHPQDPVRLWLDAEVLVPLAVEVRAAHAPDRALWASRRGYPDRAGQVVLSVTFTDMEVNAPVAPGAFPPVPAAARERDAGFVDDADGVDGTDVPPVVEWLPDGMSAHRSGTIAAAAGPAVTMRAYSGGRAWLAVAATREWPGGRLFGDLGEVVRRVDLGGAGLAYVSEDGSRVALHAADVDVVVYGSVAEADLLRVAASLGVRGGAVPAGWGESASASLAEAQAGLPGLLVPRAGTGDPGAVPGRLPGFGEPAVRVAGGTVTLTYPGAGARGFVLTQAAGDRLTPPLDADVRGVAVRGAVGRYTPSLGELEWIEDGLVVSLRSRTLALVELVAVAELLTAS